MRNFARRALILFWCGFVALIVVGGATLQILGKPPLSAGAERSGQASADLAPPPAAVAKPAEAAKPEEPKPPPTPAQAASGPAPATPVPGVQPVAQPDPALLEPSEHYNKVMLPKIASDGRTSIGVYPAPIPPPPPAMPRLGILIDGIGLAQGDSHDAIVDLPPAVSLAVSVYAPHVEDLLQEARDHGHELLLSIPMEPQGYPLNDEGFRALLTSADPPVNQRNLEWIMSRLEGYVGATGASDGLAGERFSQSGEAFADVTDELARRGLLYIDARPGATLPADLAGRAIDLVVDDPPSALEIDHKLAALEAMAKDHGTALGLAGPPRPVTLDRIGAWVRALSARGVALVPVSALSVPAREKPPVAPPPVVADGEKKPE